MANGKLASLIEKETKNLEKWENKKIECEKNIKKTRAKLQEYKMMQDSETFNTLSGIVQKSGLSIEDVLVALKNGDLLSLQEQMEANQKAEEDIDVSVDYQENNYEEGME